MNTSQSVLPTNIDEVIASLDRIILESEKTRSRLGYFPAIYNRVTKRVKEYISDGAFEDNARMERFDVIFANRYLTAYYAYQQGKPCTESWKIAFDACNTWSPMVIQHVLAGMNAHISLDLGISAVETETKDLSALKNDFDQINDILDSLVSEVEAELGEIFHPLKIFDKVTGNIYKSVAHVGIVSARHNAWQVAEEYSKLHSEAERQAYISARDQQVAKLTKSIIKPPVLARLMIGKLRFFERGSIADKVHIMNRPSS
jgi:hypothetical protein